MAKPKPINVCFTNQGADIETPWAEDFSLRRAGIQPGRATSA